MTTPLSPIRQTRPHTMRWRSVILALGGTALLAACTPTIKVEAPDKPIVINLNIKIEQEVRIKVEKDVESLIDSNDKLF